MYYLLPQLYLYIYIFFIFVIFFSLARFMKWQLFEVLYIFFGIVWRVIIIIIIIITCNTKNAIHFFYVQNLKQKNVI